MAVTLDQIKEFFIGDKKYTLSTVDTPVYHNPGEAPYKTVKANETIGRVIGVNSKGNWLKLEVDQYNPEGGWLNTSDKMYTVLLTTTKPKSVSDAVVREAKEVVNTISDSTIAKYIKWITIVAVVVILIALFYRISGK